MFTNRRSTMMVVPSAVQHFKSDIQVEPHSASSAILTATTSTLPGYHIKEVLGTVNGSSVRAKLKNSDFTSMLRSSTSGEIKQVIHILYAARDQAQERMEREAVARGANAVIGIGYGESEILGCFQSSVWGTAVLVEKVRDADDDGWRPITKIG